MFETNHCIRAFFNFVSLNSFLLNTYYDCVQWSFRYWKGVIIMFCAHTVNVMQISHVFDTLLPEVLFEVGKKWSLTVNDGFVGCSFVFKCFVVQLLQLWSLIFITPVCRCWLVERNNKGSFNNYTNITPLNVVENSRHLKKSFYRRSPHFLIFDSKE